MVTDVEEFELLEKAQFTRNVKMAASMMLAGLQAARSLSKNMGVPMDKLTVEHIIQELSPEDKKVREWKAHLQKLKTGETSA